MFCWYKKWQNALNDCLRVIISFENLMNGNIVHIELHKDMF